MATRRDRERQRGARKENRHERRQQQHTGGGEWDCIKLPEGIEVFKPEKDTNYHIDVIPYIVGKFNKNADAGDEYFELSYPIYRNLGVDEKKFIAIGELLGKRDPVAEHFAVLRKQGVEWDEMKMFKPTWRQLMLFFVHEEAEKGLQLFEGAYGTFGELLDEEIKATEDDFVDNFDDPDAGATLKVRFKAKSIGQTNPWVLASKMNFEERPNGFTANGNTKLAADVLARAEAICLDDLLKIPDYTTLKNALDGVPETDDEEASEDEEVPGDYDQDAPKQKPKTRRPAPEPEPEDEDTEEPPPPAKPKTKPESAPPPEEDGDEDVEEPTPPAKPKTKGRPAPEPEPEDEELIEEDDIPWDEEVVEDEEPPAKPAKPAAKPAAPPPTKPPVKPTAAPTPPAKPAAKPAPPPAKTAPAPPAKPTATKPAAPPAGKKKSDDWDEDWKD